MKKSFFLICVLVLSSPIWVFGQKTKKISLFPALETYCRTLPDGFSQIAEERKENLREAGDYIAKRLKNKEKVNLIFICTHNSRRSQMGQVWANVASVYYGFDPNRIVTFSGGTEATAFNERAVNALRKTGFIIEKTGLETKNQSYSLSFSSEIVAFTMFSKKFSDIQNPQKDFLAFMVCSQAAEACPVVKGADKRILLPYEDPKNYDGKPEETQKYDETCRLIAQEMFFLFDYVKSQMTDSQPKNNK